MSTPVRAPNIFLYLFLVVGLIALGVGSWNLLRSFQCSHWPTAEGVVTNSEMETHSGDADSSDSYSAEISYQYMVSGRHYDGNRLAFGAMSGSAGYAQEILRRYPVGQKIAVHYSPDNPAQSVIETGVHGGTWVALGVGVVFVLASLMFLQVFNSAAKAQAEGTASSPNSPVQVSPDGANTSDKPPVLMGVLFIVMGTLVIILSVYDHQAGWIADAAGGFFVAGGILLLLRRLENKLYSQLAMIPMLLIFLIIFHWVSFGGGARSGTVTTPFAILHGVNVRTPFALFTILLDVVLLAGFIRWLLRLRRK